MKQFLLTVLIKALMQVLLYRLLLAQLISFRRQLSTILGGIFCWYSLCHQWKVLLLQVHTLSSLDRMHEYVYVYIKHSMRTPGKY